MAEINSASGTKIYIGPVASQATANTLVALKALTYVEIGMVESLPDFGDTSAEINFTSLGDNRTRKAKGPRNAGTFSLTVGADPLDAGQIALKAAEGTNTKYAFKVVFNDKQTSGGVGSEAYFRGLVMSRSRPGGGADSVLRRVYNIGIDSDVFESDAT